MLFKRPLRQSNRLIHTGAMTTQLTPELQLLRQALMGDIDLRFAAVDQKFAAIDERFASIDEKFASIDERFAAIDEKFASIDANFASIDNRFASIDEKLTAIDKKLKANDDQFAGIAQQFEAQTELIMAFEARLGKKIDALAKDVRTIKRTVKSHEVRISNLEALTA